MTIVNVMWDSGCAFSSVHKVHRLILSQADKRVPQQTWLLQGEAVAGLDAPGAGRFWRLPRRLLKGRHLWRWLQLPWRWVMRRALQDCDARLVLIDGMGAARIMLPVISRMPDTQGVVIVHGHVSLRRSDRTLLTNFPSARLRLVAVSEVLATALNHQLAMPVTVLRSAMEPMSFRQNLLGRQEARRELGLADDCLVMGAVGRLVPDKGFETLIEAFAVVAQKQRTLQLVILGEGESRSILEQRVATLGLEARVSMPGHRGDAATLYQAFDWILVPSFAEGLGLVLQEAVMANVPVMVSDLPVFHEQLGESGLYARAGDIQAWASGLDRCLELDGAQVVENQALTLNAEGAWQRFGETCQQLLVVE